MLYEKGRDVDSICPLGCRCAASGARIRVYFTCSVCHAGSVREAPGAAPRIVHRAGMAHRTGEVDTIDALLHAAHGASQWADRIERLCLFRRACRGSTSTRGARGNSWEALPKSSHKMPNPGSTSSRARPQLESVFEMLLDVVEGDASLQPDDHVDESTSATISAAAPIAPRPGFRPPRAEPRVSRRTPGLVVRVCGCSGRILRPAQRKVKYTTESGRFRLPKCVRA